jgi:hypothetical protein
MLARVTIYTPVLSTSIMKCILDIFPNNEGAFIYKFDILNRLRHAMTLLPQSQPLTTTPLVHFFWR